MGAPYCAWEPRVGEAFKRAVQRGVSVPELARAITDLFTRLWGSCTKASRASLALRVFPDLSEEELMELALVDAYANALDDFVDLECVDQARGRGARALYVRTILLVNTLVSSPEARLFLGRLGASKVFDSEYQFRLIADQETLPHTHNGLLGLIEELYTSQAYDMGFFFAYPARRRLPEEQAQRLIEAGIVFRTLWLLLDNLADMEEDRRNNIVTGVRLALDYVGEPSLVAELAERLDKKFRRTIEELEGVSYAANLQGEYEKLLTLLREELRSIKP